MVNFQDAFTDLYDFFFSYDLNIMHAWGVVELRVYLAKKKSWLLNISPEL